MTRRTACTPAAASVSWKARVNRGFRSRFRKRFPIRKPIGDDVALLLVEPAGEGDQEELQGM
ncbi:MAG TPA: hypothetical protein VKE51_42545 [Vicinamibacterales bacterium]|nr:hypothetical protein [Vicinamibacterales bacterium]